METINGYKIDHFPFKQMKVVSDILFYDGPILTHFKADGFDYLSYWVDYDENVNRWLIFKVEEEDLYKYLSNQQSLRSLIMSSNNHHVYIVDIDDDYKETYMLSVSEISKDYIPKETLYEADLPEDYLYLEERYGFDGEVLSQFTYVVNTYTNKQLKSIATHKYRRSIFFNQQRASA